MASSSLIQRIGSLERAFPEPPCPSCAGFEWETGIVFLIRGSIDVEADELSTDAALSRPEYCPTCGAHHPIHTVIDLGGAGWDAI